MGQWTDAKYHSRGCISLMTLCQEIICSRQEITCGCQEKSKLMFRDSLEMRIGVWGIHWKLFLPGLNFTPALPLYMKRGLQYQSINVHRSALSMTLKPIEGFSVGQHPLVCWLLKGIFNSRPPRQKVCPSWSVQAVLQHLAMWSPACQVWI